jgi:hypothetical protein
MPEVHVVHAYPQALGLNRRVRAWLDLRAERPRDPGIHPSDISRLCPVLEYYIEQANLDLCSGNPTRIEKGIAFRRAVLEARRFDANLKMEFRVGDAIHADAQFYLGALGYLWGVWECPHCGDATPEGFMPRTLLRDRDGQWMHDAAPCRACGGRNYRHDNNWLYREPSVGDTELARQYGYKGHMDGDLRFHQDGNWYRYVVEVKSINEAGYSGKRGDPLPKPEHVEQASLYGYLKGISHILFIYVNKNQVSEWREIIVPVDMAAVGRAQAKAEAIIASRETGAPPLQARLCLDPREERARSCPAQQACWGCVPTGFSVGRGR